MTDTLLEEVVIEKGEEAETERGVMGRDGLGPTPPGREEVDKLSRELRGPPMEEDVERASGLTRDCRPPLILARVETGEEESTAVGLLATDDVSSSDC